MFESGNLCTWQVLRMDLSSHDGSYGCTCHARAVQHNRPVRLLWCSKSTAAAVMHHLTQLWVVHSMAVWEQGGSCVLQIPSIKWEKGAQSCDHEANNGWR
jgi:hypothetical protein